MPTRPVRTPAIEETVCQYESVLSSVIPDVDTYGDEAIAAQEGACDATEPAAKATAAAGGGAAGAARLGHGHRGGDRKKGESESSEGSDAREHVV